MIRVPIICIFRARTVRVPICTVAVSTGVSANEHVAAAEADAQAKYPYLELAAGDPLQRWWRPLYGLELTLECAALAIVIIRDLWGGDTIVHAAATQATALLLGYWSQSVGVLVGATLPRALRIAEVDLDARIDLEARSLLPRWSRFAEIT